MKVKAIQTIAIWQQADGNLWSFPNQLPTWRPLLVVNGQIAWQYSIVAMG
jgi:hypothetical protein